MSEQLMSEWPWALLAVLAGFATGFSWWGVRRAPSWQVAGRRPGGAEGADRAGPRPAVEASAVAVEVPVTVLADLLVALLDAGLPPGPAMATLQQQLARSGLRAGPGLPVLESALALAARSGLAPSPLIAAGAAERFRAETAAQTEAANRLGVLVALPVGLCLLPAFVAATVVPMVLGLLR